MIALILSGGLALIFSLVGTPLFIRLLVRRGYGQFIRDDGPTAHHTKRGTPTMGGAVVVAAVLASYLLTHLVVFLLNPQTEGPTVSGALLLFLMCAMGGVGFLDDALKISRQRSLGLTAAAKLVLQGVIGIVFAVLALSFPDANGITPASTAVSFVRDTRLDLAFAGPALGVVLFVIWANLIVTATTNGVNLTDGLDGLAAGASIMVFSGYLIMGFWQYNQNCASPRIVQGGACYSVRDPIDLAMLAAALIGALVGFLWWNTSPAKIFMGDTGSLALGGAVAAFAILSRTELLLIILAGLFVIISLSVILQVGYFKLTRGRRLFKMAPLQHHFELKGWAEVTVVVRFWIICGLGVAVAVGIFYAEWVALA